MSLRYGYNTNGLAHHRLADAIALLAELGYDGCALTLDHCHLDPFAPDLARAVNELGKLVQAHGLSLVIETGARYLLDPARKHHPTFLVDDEAGRQLRIDFLRRAIAVARDLGAEAVSLWSGNLPASVEPELAWTRLRDGLAVLLPEAARAGVPLAFEPEPGMLVSSVADFTRLHAELPDLRLTLDLGHCLLTETGPIADVVRSVAPLLVNVHAEDMRRPVHEHLAFGQGEMVYGPILAALEACGYRGLINVELSRDSHRAPEVARQALDYLRRAEQERAA